MTPTQIPQKLQIISFLNGLCFYAPVALLVRTQNGISISQFFTLQMILSIGVLVFEVPTGHLSDHIGYRNTLVLSQALLLLARILLLFSHCFWLFAAEAVIEALSISFLSGTESAYIYSNCKENDFALISSQITRSGTIGFLVSTVSYSLILPFLGISGLVALTCISTAFSLLMTVRLPQGEQSSLKNERTEKVLLPPKSWPFFALLGAISIGGLVLNFFNAVKIERIGLAYEALTLIILGYSAVELLAPAIIRHISLTKRKHTILFLLIVSAGGFSGLYFTDTKLAILFMLFLPLILSILSTLSSELINELIDRYNLSHLRATILSVFNIGNSLMEIAFLAGSALLSDSDGNSAFLFTAITTLLVCLICGFYFLFPTYSCRLRPKNL